MFEPPFLLQLAQALRVDARESLTRASSEDRLSPGGLKAAQWRLEAASALIAAAKLEEISRSPGSAPSATQLHLPSSPSQAPSK